jgi:hypothetical protein
MQTLNIADNSAMAAYFAGLEPKMQQAAANVLADRFREIQAEAAKAQPTIPGVYKSDTGTFFRVKFSKSQRLYAEVITKTDAGVSFTYQSGAIYRLEAGARLSTEECESLGLLFGCCLICGRALTVKKSVLQGMGPVCAKRYSSYSL